MAEADFPTASEAEIQEGKSLAWLSYVAVLFVIPLVLHRNNPFSRYHARQGMALFFAEALLSLFWVLMAVIVGLIQVASYSATGFGIGGLCGLLLVIVIVILWALLSILAVIGIIQAVSGRFWKMPVFGDIAEKWFKGMINV